MLLTKVIVISYEISLTLVPFTLTLSAFQIFKERPPRMVEVSKSYGTISTRLKKAKDKVLVYLWHLYPYACLYSIKI